MLNKIASLILVVALVTALAATATFASASSNVTSKTDRPEAPLPLISAPTDKPSTNEGLRTDMLRLIANARAGKVAPRERSQIQPAKRNNLSKGTKIAIGVGIAVAVVAVVLIARSPILHDGR